MPQAHTHIHTKHTVHNYHWKPVSCCICVVCAYLCVKMMIWTLFCCSCSVTKTHNSHPICIQISMFPLDTKILGLSSELTLIIWHWNMAHWMWVFVVAAAHSHRWFWKPSVWGALHYSLVVRRLCMCVLASHFLSPLCWNICVDDVFSLCYESHYQGCIFVALVSGDTDTVRKCAAVQKGKH